MNEAKKMLDIRKTVAEAIEGARRLGYEKSYDVALAVERALGMNGFEVRYKKGFAPKED